MPQRFLTAEIRTVWGQSLGLLMLREKTLAPGLRGYHGWAKLEIDSKR